MHAGSIFELFNQQPTGIMYFNIAISRGQAPAQQVIEKEVIKEVEKLVPAKLDLNTEKHSCENGGTLPEGLGVSKELMLHMQQAWKDAMSGSKGCELKAAAAMAALCTRPEELFLAGSMHQQFVDQVIAMKGGSLFDLFKWMSPGMKVFDMTDFFRDSRDPKR